MIAPGEPELGESKKNVLRILDMFDPGLSHRLDGPKIDSPANAITLTHEYNIDSLEQGFLRDPLFPVTRALTLSPSRTIDPPDYRLLGVHCAIAHIMKLSGAGE